MTTFDGWLVAVLLSCVAGIAAALVTSRRGGITAVIVCGTLTGVACIGAGVAAMISPAAVARVLWTIPSLGEITLRGDSLAGCFLVVTGLVVIPVSIFGGTALPMLSARYSVRVYAGMYFTLLAAIAWVLVSDDVFSFFVAWEIMSILCYLLVSFEHEVAEHRNAGYLMLAVSEAGALAALLGLVVVATHAHSLEFSAMRGSGATLGAGARTAVFLLTFFGFGVKAGLVPVNLWLPRAYTAAPAAFVPLLAGATLNLGLYGILRVNGDLMPVTSILPGLIALGIGTLSALIGILFATVASDLKTVLAHSSIENAGIVTVGFGAGFVFAADGLPVLAAMALLVALYHLVNHSIYKTLLFIGAGAVEERAGTRDLDQLGGLIRRMPWVAAGVLVGVVGIAALPPLNGFVSEWLTLQTLLRGAELPSIGVRIALALCGALLALTAALAVTCFAKFFAMGFLGTSRSVRAEESRDGERSTLIALGLLAACCLLLGVLPTYVIGALDRAVAPITGASGAATLVPPFFDHAPSHASLPPAFVSEFHDLGAQTGQSVVPGPGLVIMHRGGVDNPVVFAASPTYLVLVLLALLGMTYAAVRVTAARRRITRRVCWDGGIHRLLPEMTYTATGFSNPVRVIFHAIFRPTVIEDTQETVAEHFRTAIRREIVTVHPVDRFVLVPASASAFAVARWVARMHHGRLNAYVLYVLLALLAAFLLLARA